MTKIWHAENTKLIYIVNFDGAANHTRNDFHLVEKICSSVIILVQFAGGIRN